MSSHIIEGSQSLHQVVEAYTTPSKPVDENPVQQVAQGVFLQEQSCASSSSEQFVFSEILLPNEVIYRILSLFIENLPPKEAAREIAQKALLSAQWRQVSRALLTDCINTEKLSFQDIGINTIEKLKCFLIAHGEGLRSLPLKFLYVNTSEASEVKEIIELCPNLESLSMYIFDTTDSTLKDIATLKKLTHLDLEFNGKFNISGLQDIATLENLTHLDLNIVCLFSSFIDDDAKEIAKLKKITHLELIGSTNFTNNAIKELSTLTELTYLNIRNSKNITDEAMKDLVKLSKLEWLSLSYCTQLTDVGIESIATLENLTYLDLSFIILTDRALKSIAKLQKLTHLQFLICLDRLGLNYLKFTDNGMKYIGQLTNLTHLGLRGAKLITDEAAKEISKLRKLKYLDLRECWNLGDRAAIEIATLTNLTELYLYQNNELTDNGVAEFAKLLNLRRLDVQHCQGIRDAFARSIGMLKSLEYLNLSDCYGLTSAAIEEIVKLKNLKRLDYQYPGFEGSDDDAALGLIVSNLTNIEWLSLVGWRPSDDMARRIAKLPKLKLLDLRESETLSKAVKKEIKASFKGEVYLRG